VKIEYRCSGCGNKKPCNFVPEVKRPPTELRDICGLRWGGCGAVQQLEMVVTHEGGDE